MQLAPSALHATAEALAHLLGPWEITEPDHEGIVHLLGPFERHIGMRLLHDGSTIQLWATGGTQPTPPVDTENHSDDVHPLPYGHRWHTCAHIGSLTEDQDPAVELYTAITDNLLPVFDAKPSCVGHRPWQSEASDDIEPADADTTMQVAAAADVDPDTHADESRGTNAPREAPAPAATPQPEPEPEPRAKRTTTRTRRKAENPTDAKPKPSAPRKRTAKSARA